MKILSCMPNRNPFVDLLRGFSILLVLIIHFHLIYDLEQSLFSHLIPKSILMPILLNGHYGVIMFFAISGFLITSLSYQRFGSLSQVDIKKFYLFRVGRIIPSLALMVGLVFLFSLFGLEAFVNRADSPSWLVIFVSIATFTYNVLMLEYGYFNDCFNTLWSISIEEVFYLFFPLYVLSLKREKYIVLGFLLFVLLGPVYRFGHRNDAVDIAALFNYPAAFDCLSIGCLFAILDQRMKASQFFFQFRWIAILGLIITFFYSLIWQNLVFGISLISFFTAACLWLYKGRDMKSWLLKVSAPLRFMGQKSYELYLFHIIVLGLFRAVLGNSLQGSILKVALFFAFLILSTFIAAVVSHYYSVPSNQYLRKKF